MTILLICIGIFLATTDVSLIPKIAATTCNADSDCGATGCANSSCSPSCNSIECCVAPGVCDGGFCVSSGNCGCSTNSCGGGSSCDCEPTCTAPVIGSVISDINETTEGGVTVNTFTITSNIANWGADEDKSDCEDNSCEYENFSGNGYVTITNLTDNNRDVTSLCQETFPNEDVLRYTPGPIQCTFEQIPTEWAGTTQVFQITVHNNCSSTSTTIEESVPIDFPPNELAYCTDSEITGLLDRGDGTYVGRPNTQFTYSYLAGGNLNDGYGLPKSMDFQYEPIAASTNKYFLHYSYPNAINAAIDTYVIAQNGGNDPSNNPIGGGAKPLTYANLIDDYETIQSDSNILSCNDECDPNNNLCNVNLACTPQSGWSEWSLSNDLDSLIDDGESFSSLNFIVDPRDSSSVEQVQNVFLTSTNGTPFQYSRTNDGSSWSTWDLNDDFSGYGLLPSGLESDSPFQAFDVFYDTRGGDPRFIQHYIRDDLFYKRVDNLDGNGWSDWQASSEFNSVGSGEFQGFDMVLNNQGIVNQNLIRGDELYYRLYLDNAWTSWQILPDFEEEFADAVGDGSFQGINRYMDINGDLIQHVLYNNRLFIRQDDPNPTARCRKPENPESITCEDVGGGGSTNLNSINGITMKHRILDNISLGLYCTEDDVTNTTGEVCNYNEDCDLDITNVPPEILNSDKRIAGTTQDFKYIGALSDSDIPDSVKDEVSCQPDVGDINEDYFEFSATFTDDDGPEDVDVIEFSLTPERYFVDSNDDGLFDANGVSGVAHYYNKWPVKVAFSKNWYTNTRPTEGIANGAFMVRSSNVVDIGVADSPLSKTCLSGGTLQSSSTPTGFEASVLESNANPLADTNYSMNCYSHNPQFWGQADVSGSTYTLTEDLGVPASTKYPYRLVEGSTVEYTNGEVNVNLIFEFLPADENRWGFREDSTQENWISAWSVLDRGGLYDAFEGNGFEAAGNQYVQFHSDLSDSFVFDLTPPSLDATVSNPNDSDIVSLDLEAVDYDSSNNDNFTEVTGIYGEAYLEPNNDDTIENPEISLVGSEALYNPIEGSSDLPWGDPYLIDDQLEGDSDVNITKSYEIDIRENDSGTLTPGIAVVDRACNVSAVGESVDWNKDPDEPPTCTTPPCDDGGCTGLACTEPTPLYSPWFVSQGGKFYSDGAIDNPIPTPDGSYGAAPIDLSNPASSMTDSYISNSNFSIPNDQPSAIRDYVSGLNGYDLNSIFSEEQGIASELISTTRSATAEQGLDCGDSSGVCVEDYGSGDVDISTEFSCTDQTVIHIIDGDLNINAEILDSSINGCVFLVTGDITVGTMNDSNDVEGNYEVLNGMFISDGQFITEYDGVGTYAEGLYVRGAIITNGLGTGVSRGFELNRSFKTTSNSDYPSHIFEYSPKYIYQTRDIFGENQPTYKTEIGL